MPTIALLLALQAHAAKPDATLPVSMSEDGLITASWDCATTSIDTSDKKGRGHAACIKSYQLDPGTGATFVEVLITTDTPAIKDLDRHNLWLEQRYTDGTRWRIKYFGVEESGIELPKRAPERGELRQNFRAVFSYNSFDLPGDIDTLELNVSGGPSTTWAMASPLSWSTPIVARTLAIQEDPAQTCVFEKVGKNNSGRVERYLSEQRMSEDFVLSFDWALDGDGKVKVNLPQPWFSIDIDHNRIAIRGAEVFIHKLPSLSRNAMRPNPVEIRFDGEDATVRVGEQTFGPFFARQRPANGKALAIELQTGGKDVLTNLTASMCVPVPEKIEAAPPPPPMAVAAAPAAQPAASEERVKRRGGNPLAALASLRGSLSVHTSSTTASSSNGDVSVQSTSTSVSLGGGTATQPVAQPQPMAPAPRPVAAVDYWSVEMRGLTPQHQVWLAGQPVPWDPQRAAFFVPRIYTGQSMRVYDPRTTLDWTGDAVPQQFGVLEVCTFTSLGANYGIHCEVQGGMSGTAVMAPVGPVAMDDRRFASLRAQVEDASFTSDKMGIIETAAGRNHFTAGQIVRLIDSISMDNDQVDAAVILYERCVDLHNWSRVYGVLDFESSKRELRQRTE